jgi:hypothetical protein
MTVIVGYLVDNLQVATFAYIMYAPRKKDNICFSTAVKNTNRNRKFIY